MKLKKLSLSVVLLLTAGLVSAQEFYAGAGLGIVHVKDSDSFVEQGTSVEIKIQDKTFGGRIFGGVEFTENFAAEIAYIESGTAKDDARIFIDGEEFATTPIETELSATMVSLIGMVPLNDDVRLFAKAGYYDGEQKASTPGGLTLPGDVVLSTPGATVKEDSDGATFGLGARAQVTESFTVRVDYDWFDTDIDTVQSFGLSLQFGFGN
ncbi:MAG: outer membrane beta-barrel protein [Woeseiaceae bacterium]|nr:outer membrane beta-barrel protein [Woeseiaceae bacterium]